MTKIRMLATLGLSVLLAGITFCGFYLLGVEVASAASSPGGITIGGSSDTSTGKSKGVFPVKARVSWGDGLGAGRGHQGQDLMADCRRKIVASKAGVVRVVAYQASGAGNYVVVRGTDSMFDYVYMHMIKPPKVKRGQKVDAGDVLGYVGSTGRSSACHLHFEMWTRPGWYRGGEVSNPTPHLKSWRRTS